MKKKGRQGDNRISLPLPSSSDLRGRQSVRATFKLTPRAISIVTVLAAQLGIKQKSLFDHLIDDVRSLNRIAGEIESERFSQLDRVQKTYVLSRKTVSCLGEASKKFDAPRDALVEYSIQRLLPIIAEERKKHRKREQILGEITEYLKRGDKILQKSRALLGDDDPVCSRFETAMGVCGDVHRSIRSFVKKGRIIEDF